LTTTETVAVLKQPDGSVPVTVYVVEETGTSVTEAPERFPGIQSNVVAPFAVKVTDAPLQTALLEIVAVTDGVGFTVMVDIAIEVQPFAAVPVTVYVVVVFGETVTVVPLKLPGCQS
jgi:hypothetical protein